MIRTYLAWAEHRIEREGTRANHYQEGRQELQTTTHHPWVLTQAYGFLFHMKASDQTTRATTEISVFGQNNPAAGAP